MHFIALPPCGAEPCNCTLPDGAAVKWCSLCGYWGNHFRATHADANEVAPANEEDQLYGGAFEEEKEENKDNNTIDDNPIADDNLIAEEQPSSSTFDCLRTAGLF